MPGSWRSLASDRFPPGHGHKGGLPRGGLINGIGWKAQPPHHLSRVDPERRARLFDETFVAVTVAHQVVGAPLGQGPSDVRVVSHGHPPSIQLKFGKLAV